jgi:hypothetical protein
LRSSFYFRDYLQKYTKKATTSVDHTSMFVYNGDMILANMSLTFEAEELATSAKRCKASLAEIKRGTANIIYLQNLSQTYMDTAVHDPAKTEDHATGAAQVVGEMEKSRESAAEMYKQIENALIQAEKIEASSEQVVKLRALAAEAKAEIAKFTPTLIHVTNIAQMLEVLCWCQHATSVITQFQLTEWDIITEQTAALMRINIELAKNDAILARRAMQAMDPVNDLATAAVCRVNKVEAAIAVAEARVEATLTKSSSIGPLS